MSDHCCAVEDLAEHNHTLKKVLWFVFTLNLMMFLVELVAGYFYHSTALMADSLDMLSDACVYGVSILVVAKSNHIKARVSLVKGVAMTLMALFVVYELVMRILNPVVLDGHVISLVGTLALLVNGLCLWLLFKYKQGDINVRSAWVCSRNDMTANAGVIIAGLLVFFTGSQWPDYVIGAGIAILVLFSSFKVITDSFKELKSTS